VPKVKACKRCRALTQGDVCPLCGSRELTFNWEGVVAVLDPERSEVARRLGYERSGLYALRVAEE